MVVLKRYLVLIAIVVVGFLLRFYQLAAVPPSLNIDEVSIGYNAYSILKTGKDEFGTPFPLAFRSYDDYKPPLYIYLTVPSVAVFGLSDFAVRFPAAVMGVLAIISTYLLVTELFPRKRSVALLSAFFLAILPWHLQFTRTAYEVGAMALFTTSGLYLFLRGLRKKNIALLIAAGIVLGSAGYLYQAARLFLPFLVGSTVLFNLQLKKKVIVPLTIFLLAFGVIFLPVFLQSLTPEGQSRFKGTSLFQDWEPHVNGIGRKQIDWLARNRIGAMAFHPEPLFYGSKFLVSYMMHFRFDFLYVGLGGPKVNLIPNVGLEYIYMLPLLIVGVYYSLGSRYKRSAALLFTWVLLSPLPAAFTWEVPSSIRTAIMIPALEIIAAFGAVALFYRLQKIRWQRLAYIGVLVLCCLYFLSYTLHMLFFHQPTYLNGQWYGIYRDVVRKTMELAPNYKRVIVGNNLDQPQGFFLYYSGYDPGQYLKEGGTVSGSYTETTNKMGNIEFRPLEFGRQGGSDILYVGRAEDLPGSGNVIATFKWASGKEAIKIVKQ